MNTKITKNSQRTVIVGLDGVPYGLIKNLTEAGVMPNTAKIVQEGIFRQMESSIPEISSVAWSSIITGANPGEHGIFGFTELSPESYRLSFPNFTNLKTKPFWKNRPNSKSAIINVPSTYPAESLNGILIAGFVALDLNKAVYPSSLVEELKKLDYRIDVDSQKAHQSTDLFLRDLNNTLEARIAAYRNLWNKEYWDYFMIVFTGTDRLNHFLWDAYEDSSHKYHSFFIDYLKKIDEVIGEIEEQIEKRQYDNLIILSDHGFEKLNKMIYINKYLRDCGFLKLRNIPANSFNDIDEGTIAFALDPGRIYINFEGKYPRGSIKRSETDKIVEELLEAFEHFEVDDKAVINRIYRKEEIYKGALIDRAPDLVLMSNAGFDLKANIKTDKLWDKTVFTGKHTQHDAFLLVKGLPSSEAKGCCMSAIIPEKVNVSNVVNIIY